VLDRLTASGIEVDVCASCAGVWLDKGELAVLKLTGTVSEMLRLKPAGEADAPASEAEGKLECPACSGALSILPVADVDIDICESCQGIWLDKGELDVALAALDSRTDRDLFNALTGVIRTKRSD
jgi:Zn-finger nucleic acid-binding protein